MKTLKRRIGRLTPDCVVALCLTAKLQAQTNLQFTAAVATDEQAIHLVWLSEPNRFYQIQCADSLAGNPDGSTAWQTLYDDYPSQGTNTFWLDTGNYNVVPAIQHPKNSPMRFYRILDKGVDDLVSDEPSISITSPTSGAVVTGQLTITVAASTDQPVLSTKLYVDGQEMQSSDDGSNYVINTCEWPNGSHILFATAKCATGLGDALNGPTVTFGRAVSAFVPVMFSNLVTRISFSQPVFNPAAGQTQQVSAVFAANSDWALNIVDASSNTVKSATGSGISMLYNWDGTDSNRQPVAAGIYYYYISAQTNGQPYQSQANGGSEGSNVGSPPAPMFASTASSESVDNTELWALPADGTGSAVPLALYPPGVVDTNNFLIFEASSSGMQALLMPRSQTRLATAGTSLSGSNVGGSPMDAGAGYSGAAAQTAGAAPSRPPSKPAVGTVGQFGIAYQDYFPEMLQIAAPANGLLGKVYIQGSTQNANLPFVESLEDEDFIATMARGGWQSGFAKKNGQLRPSDLRSSSFGGANVFNSGGSFGMLHLHGAYGTSQDATTGANFAQQIYFAVDGRQNTGTAYVRMSEMDLGNPGTNGLKWMVLSCCNSLRQQNWNSIRNAGWKPFNQNLHLLLGANSIMDAGNDRMFAKFMVGLDLNPKQTIIDAWYSSGKWCATKSPVYFAVAGFDDCKQDMLTGTNNYTPQGSVFYETKQVK